MSDFDELRIIKTNLRWQNFLYSRQSLSIFQKSKLDSNYELQITNYKLLFPTQKVS